MPVSELNNLPFLNSSEQGVIGGQTIPFTFVIPKGRWKFILARTTYLSNAVIGTRTPTFEIFDDTGTSIFVIPLGGQLQNSLISYYWAQGNVVVNAFGIIFQKGVPTDLTLFENWSMKFDAANANAGDIHTISFQLKGI